MKNVMLMMLGLVLVTGPASAGLIYDTGFETADGFANNTSVHDVDGWKLEHITCVTAETNAISGDMSLNLRHDVDDAICYNAFTAANYDVVTAEWKVKKLNTDAGTGDLAWYFMDGGGSSDRATSLVFDETTDGVYRLTAHNGGSSTEIKTGLAADTVYTIRMEANYLTDKYNVYIDGERVATNFGFRYAAGEITRLRMFSNDHNDKGVVDDVRIWNTVRETGFGTEDGFTGGGSIDNVGGWDAYSGSCTTVASGIDGMSLSVLDNGTAARAELRFVETTDVVVECKVKTDSTQGDTYIQLFDGGKDGGTEGVRIQFDGGAPGEIYAYSGETKGTSLMDFDSSTVYGVKIVVDNTAGKYDLYIDSGAGYVLKANNYDLFATVGDLDTLLYVCNDSSPHTAALLDDLVIIPEPATMTLLLLGLPFALRRRRR